MNDPNSGAVDSEASRTDQTIAVIKRQSMAEVVREAIDAMIEGNNAPAPGERRQRALALAGTYQGKEDLSVRHDDYLSEDFAR